MPIPTPQQKTYYVSSLPVDTPAVPIALWDKKIAILPNGDQYSCDGMAWLPYGTTAGAVGALDATSPITGNPSALDTPTEIAAAIQDLQNFRDTLDADSNDIADQLDETYHTLTITAPGQTVFTLPKPARQPLLAVVVMENLTYRYGVNDFTIDIDNVTLTWHNPIVLQPGYSFTITYR